jgi:hypothetical protein
MKLFNNQNNGHDEHDHTQDKSVIERLKRKVKDYWKSMYCSDKCKKMPRGSYYIIRSMSWARGDGWRRNHPKSLNKKH